MKKGFMVLLLVFSMFFIPLTAQADEPPRVFLDGQELSFDVLPVVVDGRLLVPMSNIFQRFGMNPIYNPDRNYVCCGYTGEDFWLEIGSNVAYVRDKAIYMDVPAQIIDGRCMVPLKVVAEVCLCKVSYDDKTNVVLIERGRNDLEKLNMYQGYIASTQTPVYEGQRDFSIQSPLIACSAEFVGCSEDMIVFDWSFKDGGNKETILSETKPIKSTTVFSVLPREKYKLGTWVLELFSNGHRLAEYYFLIVDNQDIYGTLAWENGSYTGYLNKERPCGYGEIKLNDGTEIKACFNAGGSYSSGATNSAGYKYMEQLELPAGVSSSNYSTHSFMDGHWSYSNGCQYDGSLYVDNNTYEQSNPANISYIVYGTFEEKDGSTRSLAGSYIGFNPSYRFDLLIK